MKGGGQMNMEIGIKGIGIVTKSEITDKKVSLADFIEMDSQENTESVIVAEPATDEPEQEESADTDAEEEAAESDHEAEIENVPEDTVQLDVSEFSESVEYGDVGSVEEVVDVVAQEDDMSDSEGSVSPARASDFGPTALTQSAVDKNFPKDAPYEVMGCTIRYVDPVDKTPRSEMLQHFCKSLDEVKSRVRSGDIGDEFLIMTVAEAEAKGAKGVIADIWALVAVGHISVCLEDQEVMSFMDSKWIK